MFIVEIVESAGMDKETKHLKPPSPSQLTTVAILLSGFLRLCVTHTTRTHVHLCVCRYCICVYTFIFTKPRQGCRQECKTYLFIS